MRNQTRRAKKERREGERERAERRERNTEETTQRSRQQTQRERHNRQRERDRDTEKNIICRFLVKYSHYNGKDPKDYCTIEPHTTYIFLKTIETIFFF